MRISSKSSRASGICVALLALLQPAFGRAQAYSRPGQIATPTRQTNAPDRSTVPLEFKQTSLPEAAVNFPFRASVQITGATSACSVTLTGDLPPGLFLQAGAGTVAIGGVPTREGDYEFTLLATDVDGLSAKQSYTLHINAPIFHPEVMTAIISVTETTHVSDTDLAFFPVVIAITETTHVSDGSEAFTPVISNVTETTHVSDTVSIVAALGLTPTTLSAGTVNAVYPFTVFSAVGNTGAVTYSESGAAPAGMTWATQSGKPVIFGTPTQGGSFPFSITAKDSVNTSIVPYTLIINPGAQTISIGALPTPTYGGASFSLSASSTSGLTVSIASTSPLASGSNPFAPVGAGSASFQATQIGNASYSAATPVNFNVTIASAPLTATPTAVTRIFDQLNPPFTSYTFATFVNGDSSSVITGTPIFSTTATPISPATIYPISLALGTLSTTNYIISAGTGVLTITPAAQVITFYPLPTLTNGAVFPLSARSSSGLAVTYSVTGPASITSNTLTVTGSGLVTVTASQAGNTNYSSATNIVRSFTAP